jgi:hypothetical protein
MNSEHKIEDLNKVLIAFRSYNIKKHELWNILLMAKISGKVSTKTFSVI